MPNLPNILHLVDDATPGGVMRVLDHICSCPVMARSARHEVQQVSSLSGLGSDAPDVIVSHLALNWRRLPGMIALRARFAGRPLLHVEHSYTEAFTALNVSSRLRFFTMLRNSYALFDEVVAVSEGQGAWMRRRRLVQADRLRVIPPVVPLEGFRALAPPCGGRFRSRHVGALRAQRPRVIGAIGRLHRQKGFDLLIAAFRTLPGRDLALHLYGDGPERARLQALAGADLRIVFFGHVPCPEAALQSVDIVAMPSRWEAFGLVALEARAAGRQLVCSDLDGLPMSAGDGAIFVEDHEVSPWADALQEALERPRIREGGARAEGAEAAFARRWHALISGHATRKAVLPLGQQTSPLA